MEIINILPERNMDGAELGSMGMYLTHLVESSTHYAKLAKRAQHYKILDNSLIELGGSVSVQRVLHAAQTIGADEIVLPDVFRDGMYTLGTVKNALVYLEANKLIGEYKLMAVCQGRDVQEFIQCFEDLVNMPYIDVIGIPKVCAKMHPQGRPFFEALWENCPKEIHLLGLWYGTEEIGRYRHPEKIRSMDTCHLSWLAHHRLPIDAVRPDGFTIDLEETYVDPVRLKYLRRELNEKYSKEITSRLP